MKHALRCSKSEEDWLRRECKDAQEAKADNERTISNLEGKLQLVDEERKEMQRIINERNKVLQKQGERIEQMQRRRAGLEQSVSSLTSALQALAGEQQKRLGLGEVVNSSELGGLRGLSSTVNIGEIVSGATSNSVSTMRGADAHHRRMCHQQQQQQHLGISMSSPALDGIPPGRSYAYESTLPYRGAHQHHTHQQVQQNSRQHTQQQEQQQQAQSYGHCPPSKIENVVGFGQMFPDIENSKDRSIVESNGGNGSKRSSGDISSSNTSTGTSTGINEKGNYKVKIGDKENEATKGKGRRHTYKSPYQQPLQDIFTNSIRRANKALAARGVKTSTSSSFSAKRRDGRDDTSLPKVKSLKAGRRVASAGPVLVSPNPGNL